ncbi:MAG: glycosyltransferase family 9 protein [Omnitrophica WOR_2 bacterium]
MLNSDNEAELGLVNRRLPGIHKIAILTSDELADFIFMIPSLMALRKAYPQAEIVLLGSNWHCQFLTGRPGPINRIEIIPPGFGLTNSTLMGQVGHLAEMDHFIQLMRAEEFDIALQMRADSHQANSFIQKIGAKITIGSKSPDAEPLDLNLPYTFYQLGILHYLEIVSLIGAQAVSLEPAISLSEVDKREIARVLPESEQPVAVLAPASRDPRRRWPVEKFAAVGNILAWSGAQVVLVGGEEDSRLVDDTANQMSAPVINLCGALSLRGLAGLFDRTDVFVANESGILNLANAVGAATVGIYWCGSLLNAGPVTSARHRIAISWQMNCPVCGMNCTRSDCGHQESFIAEVPQEEVAINALEFLRIDENILENRTIKTTPDHPFGIKVDPDLEEVYENPAVYCGA